MSIVIGVIAGLAAFGLCWLISKVAESPVSARSVEAREGAVTFSAPHGTDGTQHLTASMVVRPVDLQPGDRFVATGSVVVAAPFPQHNFIRVEVLRPTGETFLAAFTADSRFPLVHIERPVTV
jgi:hypothetical protein